MKKSMVVLFFVFTGIVNAQNIKNLKWLNIGDEIKQAHVDDCVTLFAETENIKTGEIVTITILEKGENNNDDIVGEYISRVNDNQIAFHWKIFHTHNTQSYLNKLSKSGFVIPDYYFIIKYDNMENTTSELLTIKAWLKVDLTYQGTKEPVVNQKYTVFVPDKTTRTGYTDAAGYIHQRDLPMGKFSYYLQENEEPHEVEQAFQEPDSPFYYVVKKGDSLWKIAGYDFIFKNNYLWEKLYEINKYNFIEENNPNLIEIDQVIIVPSIKGEQRTGTR